MLARRASIPAVTATRGAPAQQGARLVDITSVESHAPRPPGRPVRNPGHMPALATSLPRRRRWWRCASGRCPLFVHENWRWRPRCASFGESWLRAASAGPSALGSVQLSFPPDNQPALKELRQFIPDRHGQPYPGRGTLPWEWTGSTVRYTGCTPTLLGRRGVGHDAHRAGAPHLRAQPPAVRKERFRDVRAHRGRHGSSSWPPTTGSASPPPRRDCPPLAATGLRVGGPPCPGPLWHRGLQRRHPQSPTREGQAETTGTTQDGAAGSPLESAETGRWTCNALPTIGPSGEGGGEGSLLPTLAHGWRRGVQGGHMTTVAIRCWARWGAASPTTSPATTTCLRAGEAARSLGGRAHRHPMRGGPGRSHVLAVPDNSGIRGSSRFPLARRTLVVSDPVAPQAGCARSPRHAYFVTHPVTRYSCAR